MSVGRMTPTVRADGVCPPGVSDTDEDGVADPDSFCEFAAKNKERPQSGAGCGVGPELALLLPALWWLRRSRGNPKS
jgi:hypothetical protein